MKELFLSADPPTASDLLRLDQYIDEKLAPFAEKHGESKFDRVVATSSTAAALVCAVNRIPRAQRDTADRLRATTAQIRDFYELLVKEDVEERRRWIGIGPRRAEIIVGGAAVFLRALEAFHHHSLYYSAAGVRDGIIADLAARRVGMEVNALSDEQRALVQAMAARYGTSIKHVRQVAALSLRLFELTHALHQLPPISGKLLEAAAYLHDIGHFVSETGHHKHSAYLVANSDLPGFRERERLTIATICRFHRKAMPQARHAQFQELDAESKRTVLYLTPLLRLADSLDRSHEQKVKDVELSLKNGTAVLSIGGDPDIDLELWAAAKAAQAFREVYSTSITVQRLKQ